eukprot:GHVR01167780.1.p1 GENE.GHVR01167780.1~~GHVR01167780.1.p1  ORF type:complete len:253 (+),score=79.45 GHVR01167780.1:30-788(+)
MLTANWVLLVVNTVLSSTFLSVAVVLLVINKPFRHATYLVLGWSLWLLSTMIFAAFRLTAATYHGCRIGVDLLLFVLVSSFTRVIKVIKCQGRDPEQVLQQRLENASTYSEWVCISEELDELTGASLWRREVKSSEYDSMTLISHKLQLEKVIKSGNKISLRRLLRYSCDSNFCNLSNPELFSHSRVGTKMLIHEYTDTLVHALERACEINTNTHTDTHTEQHTRRNFSTVVEGENDTHTHTHTHTDNYKTT